MRGKNRLRCLSVRNETDTSAELYIHGDIIDDAYKTWLSDYDGETYPGYVLPTDVKERLASLAGKDLTVYVNSDGGSVPAGIAIANMLARHDGHTVGIVDGWAASIASVILLSCDEVHMPANTFLMIHKPAAYVEGNAADMRKMAELLDTVQEGIEKTYQAKALETTTPEAIRAAVDAETWYTAEEAAAMFDIAVDAAAAALTACSTGLTFDKMPQPVRAAKAAAQEAAENKSRAEKNRADEDRRRRITCELEILR